MAANDKTVFDPGATKPESDRTIYEGDKTVIDSPQTVPDGGTTLAAAAISDAAAQGDAAMPAENAAIVKGETILETYTVESDAIEGGMGSVWRVHHKGWNVDLAMKRPQPQCFSTEKSKADFIHECEAWINLGLHPNIVSCYYVREISGTPTIFSEWMDGGSLEGAIAKGTLYAGSEAEQQERILDIAVQFARGLYYAHEAGLIHQDVKPDNLLLTKDGEAKVADFGLAKARAVLTVLNGAPTMNDSPDSGMKSIMSPSGGYTPAYCSMEQMDGKELTRRTDIYSWAVSVMEMYIGSRPWANGVVAGLGCRGYFENTRISMPEALKGLLAQCMDAEPEDRPHDFAEIETKLHEIYKAETGSDYPRPTPKAAADTADSLNNRALSMLDLGKNAEAERLWKMALNTEKQSIVVTYNLALFRWHMGAITQIKGKNTIMEAGRLSNRAEEAKNYINELMEESGSEDIEAFCSYDLPRDRSFVTPDGMRYTAFLYYSSIAYPLREKYKNSFESMLIGSLYSKDDEKLLENHEILYGFVFPGNPQDYQNFENVIFKADISDDGHYLYLYYRSKADPTVSTRCWDIQNDSLAWDKTVDFTVSHNTPPIPTEYTLNYQYIKNDKGIGTLIIRDERTGRRREYPYRGWYKQPYIDASGGIRFDNKRFSIPPFGREASYALSQIQSWQQTAQKQDMVSMLRDEIAGELLRENVFAALEKLEKLKSILGHSRPELFEKEENDVTRYCRITELRGMNKLFFKAPCDFASSQSMEIPAYIQPSIQKKIRHKIKGRIDCTAVSPDGMRLYLRMANKDLKIFSAQNGEHIRTVGGLGHHDGATIVMLAPYMGESGRMLMTEDFVLDEKAEDLLEKIKRHEFRICPKSRLYLYRKYCNMDIKTEEVFLLKLPYTANIETSDATLLLPYHKICSIPSPEYKDYEPKLGFSDDGRYMKCGTEFYYLDYRFAFPGWTDWDEGALPYLQGFILRHPGWTEADFDGLITELQNNGLGYIRPEGVRKKLEEMRPRKKGLFGKRK